MTTHDTRPGLIRMALMGGAFIVLTIILIVFQPGSPRHADRIEPQEMSVTRGPSLSTVLPEPSAANVAVETADPPQPSVAVPAAHSLRDPLPIRGLTFRAISDLKVATNGAAPAPGEPGSLLHSVVKRSQLVQVQPNTSPPGNHYP